ncbi:MULTISPECIES: ABC transporter permease [Glycomyces]|jgi:ABC-2 type transport system permease protein|uniref:Transport permease protein n=1 Tax=Glycomyces niveus TaxID=2820287 RepID=A0ABS3U6L5_9ACTN|nr:ABC transporter permease [Glycomyces sp. NEAU-S30]MBO3733413.1 ABC transporter permease [Glycomyces sp. NEAU-S30]
MTVTQTTTKSDADAPAPVERDHLRRLLATGERPAAPSAFASARAFAWRSMLKIKHVPEQLFDILLFPIMMLLMFTYLFGGAIAGGTGDYLQFLLPGIMVMSIVMTTMYTGMSVNIDINKGVSDRFRTLPIWRAAPMVGYLLADVFRYAAAGAVMFGTGMVMGYRPEGGAAGVLLGVGLLLVFCFAFSWLWTWLGLITRSEKTVMSISMSIMFPLTFLSNIMVDPSTMPGWLQPVVKNTPISQLVDGVRGLFDGNVDSASVATTLIWSAGFIAVFGFLTIRAYNRK